ncbi:MAG: aminotransferase class IV family protein [Acidobacteriota bacterium]|nr:aminotransferase class IV family protein [Acidobacteriota bacterium]
MNVLAVAVAGRGLVDPQAPVFAADDEALLRGRAVFETARVYGGRPFMLEAHIERLARSAARVRLPAPDAEECLRLADGVVKRAGLGDLALRFYWTGRTLVSTASAIAPELEASRARGIRLAVVRWSTGALAAAKSTSYAENMGAQDQALEAGADDALLVGHDGVVLEAPTANVWWREGERLVTPALELPILAGVTRAVLLELAPAAGYAVEEGAFPLERLLAADEAFLTSSIREVMPVGSVDGTPFALGPAAYALQRALRSRT